MHTYDLIIVGGGPTGMACAIEARKNNLDYLIIDKGSLVNTIRYYPTNMTFFSTAELLELDGMPFPTTSTGKRPTRQEALEYYLRVAQIHDLQILQYTRVDDIHKEDDGFRIDTSNGQYQSQYVVLATGYYDKVNRLNVPGEDQPHVAHYYDEPFAYAGTEVAVVGGSNSAVETTLDLFRHGANVKLVHRRNELGSKIKYWMKPDIENRIKEGAIPAYWNTAVEAIHESSLALKDQNSGESFSIPADFVFLLTGYHPDAGFLKKAGVEVDETTLVPNHDPETLESNVPGLYVAGVILAGYETAKIFIENGRHHGKPIIEDILSKTKKGAGIKA